MANPAHNIGLRARVPTQDFGSAFEQARKALGWTQERASQELGVAKNTIQNWESGTSAPTGLRWLERCPQLGTLVMRHYGFVRSDRESPKPGVGNAICLNKLSSVA